MVENKLGRLKAMQGHGFLSAGITVGANPHHLLFVSLLMEASRLTCVSLFSGRFVVFCCQIQAQGD